MMTIRLELIETWSTLLAVLFLVGGVSVMPSMIDAQRILNHHSLNQQTTEKFRITESDNLNEYWTNLTELYRHYVTVRNFEILSSWNKIRQSGPVKEKVSQSCLSVIEYIIRHPIDQQWTAKLIDSNQFLSSGMMSGTTTELGDFDQCLSIRSQFEQTDFVGKYCLATVTLPRTKLFEPFTVERFNHSQLPYPWMGDYIEQWYHNDNYYSVANAICFPSICHQDEIRTILLEYYKPLNYFEFNVTYCQSAEESPDYDPRIWIALSILAIPWIFIIPGTLLDLLVLDQQKQSTTKENHRIRDKTRLHRYQQSWFIDRQTLFGQILLSFSLLTNLRQLFQIKTITTAKNKDGATEENTSNNNNDYRRFEFIHGIRAIAAIFIVMAHSGGLVLIFLHMPVSIIARYPTDAIALTRSLITQPFFNGALVVLTFFLMSGMFVVYSTATPNRLKVNFFQFVALRWLRYTPPVIGMLCLAICLEFLGNGPLFHHDIIWPTLEKCYDNWVPEILYYNNFRDYTQMCGIHTWYLSAEMQLHLVSFILLVVYTRSRRWTLYTSIGLIATAVLLVAMVIVSGLAPVIHVHKIMYPQNPTPNDSTSLIFFSPYMQFIPYFIGAIIGQCLLENRILKFSKITNRICWTLSLFLILAIPFASYVDVQTEEDTNYKGYLITDAIAFTTVLLLWSLSNGWVVYQCAIDQTSTVARFLSAKCFRPISRLSFSIYLSHLMTIWFNHHQTRTLVSISTFNEVFKNTSYTIMLTLVTSTILYTTFEAPSVRLIKLLMKSSSTSRTSVKTDHRKSSGPISNANITTISTDKNNNNNNSNPMSVSRHGSIDGDSVNNDNISIDGLTRMHLSSTSSTSDSQTDLQMSDHVEYDHSQHH